jgi:hypothetical protein
VTLSQSNVNIVSSAAGGCALFQMSGAGTGARLAFVDSNATLSCVLVHMWYVSSTTLGDCTFITQNSDVALIAGSSDMRFIYFTVPSTGMSNAMVLVDRTTVLARSSTTPAAGTVMIDFTALKSSQLIVRDSNLTITGPPIGATGITAGTLTNSTIIVERSTVLVESRTQNALAIYLSGASIGSALLVRDCAITALNDPLGIYGSSDSRNRRVRRHHRDVDKRCGVRNPLKVEICLSFLRDCHANEQRERDRLGVRLRIQRVRGYVRGTRAAPVVRSHRYCVGSDGDHLQRH